MKYLSRDEVRALDRRIIEEFGVPGIVLMENAGRNVAALLLEQKPQGPVAICAGKGNNAGDGFVIARHLDNARVPVRVLRFSPAETFQGDAAIAYGIIERSGIDIRAREANVGATELLGRDLGDAEWIVDALFGTGLQGPVRAPYDKVIEAMNAAPAKVLAVDIPTGLDCDLGTPVGPTVRADITATLLAPKKGFANPEATAWLGQLHVLDIGAPRAALS